MYSDDLIEFFEAGLDLGIELQLPEHRNRNYVNEFGYCAMAVIVCGYEGSIIDRSEIEYIADYILDIPVEIQKQIIDTFDNSTYSKDQMLEYLKTL